MTAPSPTMRTALGFTGAILFIAIWHLAAASTGATGPLDVLRAGFGRGDAGDVLTHAALSMRRVLGGFAIGAGVGVTLGILTGWLPRLGAVLRAPIELLRPIPPLAWIPLAILWFGIGEGSKLYIVFLGAFFPVFTITYSAMAVLDPIYLRVGRSLGLNGARLLTRVAVPAILPDIVLSLRIALTYSFAAMVASELIAANAGLGFMILDARERGEFALMLFGVLMIGALAILSDTVLRLIFARPLARAAR
ncbi:MAG: ABC transporter permease [Pseudomonadota bacterium]|nr:ABC transporter permease [Pseudomonadota bacterium]